MEKEEEMEEDKEKEVEMEKERRMNKEYGQKGGVRMVLYCSKFRESKKMRDETRFRCKLS